MALPLITLAQVRAEGLAAIDVDDDRVEAAIQLASDFIERVCGVSFTVQTFTTLDPLVLDGTGHDTIWFAQPILTCTELGTRTAAGVQAAFNSTSFQVYNQRPPRRDDRRNPKIVRRSPNYFPEGLGNIYFAGTLGWTEAGVDGLGAPVENVPSLIQRAALLLVINDLAWLLTDEERQDDRLRRWLKSETTEGHSYALSDLALSSGASGIREADQILKAFMRPITVRA